MSTKKVATAKKTTKKTTASKTSSRKSKAQVKAQAEAIEAENAEKGNEVEETAAPVDTRSYADIFHISTVGGPAALAKLQDMGAMSGNSGTMPFNYVVPAKEGNLRGSDVSIIELRSFNPVQLEIYQSIVQVGIQENLGVILSTHTDHVALLEEDVRAEQLESYGFNFALLADSGNLRHRSIQVALDNKVGVAGVLKADDIMVPVAIWNDVKDLSILERIARVHQSNLQNDLSTRDRSGMLKYIQMYGEQMSQKDLALSLGMSDQQLTTFMLSIRYKFPVAVKGGAVGININYLKSIVDRISAETQKEHVRYSKEHLAARDAGVKDAIKTIVKFQDSAVLPDGKKLKDVLAAKTSRCLTKDQLFAILGWTSKNVEKDNKARAYLGLPLIETTPVVVEEVSGNQVEESGNQTPVVTAQVTNKVSLPPVAKPVNTSALFHATLTVIAESTPSFEPILTYIKSLYQRHTASSFDLGAELASEELQAFVSYNEEQKAMIEATGRIAPTDTIIKLMESMGIEVPTLSTTEPVIEDVNVTE